MGRMNEYGMLLHGASQAREGRDGVPEYVVQCLWYDQLMPSDGLSLDDGRSVRVVSPGWWNRGEGPDFKGAQVEINGKLVNGDVEIHLDHAAWKQHGHGDDPRYDGVLFEVVLASEPPKDSPLTSSGRRLPCLLLERFLEEDIRDLAQQLPAPDDFPFHVDMAEGQCAALTAKHGVANTHRLLVLAGEWRLQDKARALRQRIERAGAEQAVYEAFMTACGFSRFKQHFAYVARHLPYERARQLARKDATTLEAGLLKLSGLLPDALPDGAESRHYENLSAYVERSLRSLRSLPLLWPRTGVRPINYPERRMAGAARFIARTARDGLTETLERIWLEDLKPLARRRRFEELFPSAMGFWAAHCTWGGKTLTRPVALLGANRVRAIIGNVFVPYALAEARRARDRRAEERVVEFYSALPAESSNQVLKSMTPRVFGDVRPPRLTFRTQQGLLQIYQDWCVTNPSCRNCPILPFLDVGYLAAGS